MNVAQIYNILQEKKHKLALRQYSSGGNYFLIKLSKTGDILQIEELPALPEKWPQEYIDELLENGKVLKSKVFDTDRNSL